MDTGDGRVINGGAEHDLQMYNRNKSQLLQSHISYQGGDFQAMAVLEGKIYAGCHCDDWDFQGTNVYSTPRNYQKVDPISFVGRYDFNTLEHEASWNPAGLDSNSGEGPWALEADQDKCLWFAGDFNASGYSGDAAQDYLGNFGRFCPEDQMAPSTPTTLQVSFTGATANLSWQSATDDSGSVEYWVYEMAG